MAESEGHEGLLVGEEKGIPEGEPRVVGADPVALAVATDAAKYDPELARKAGDYLDEQQSLVRLQVKHFDEEHELAIAAAKRKRFADRVRNFGTDRPGPARQQIPARGAVSKLEKHYRYSGSQRLVG